MVTDSSTTLRQQVADLEAEVTRLDNELHQRASVGDKFNHEEYRKLRDMNDRIQQLQHDLVVEEAEAGTPATFYIGSDSYAGSVEYLIRYKSGDKKGFVRIVGFKFERGEAVTDFRQDKRGRWCSSHARLLVGKAIDYRDPSF